MKKMLLIVNPYAGVRKITRCLTDVIGIFNRAGYEVVTHITAGRDDATQQALQWADKVDMVVCAGGDGTYNETVTGVLRSGHDTCVGYIPCGSTNDLAASLNLSTNILTASREIVEGVPTPFDVGQFGDRYFSYIASFGAFTKASYNTSQDMKNTLGHTAYLLEGIQELSQIRKVHARIETENKVIEDDFIFGAICNSTSLGGVFKLSPKQVDMQDGKFELFLVRAPRDLLEIQECIVAVQKQTYNCAMVTFVSASDIRVTIDPSEAWTLDGEWEKGRNEVQIQCLHHAVRVAKRGKK